MPGPHVIQQVRDAIVSQLAAAGVAGGRVYLFKDRPQDPSKLPFVYVRTMGDQDERGSIGFPALEQIVATFELTIAVAQTGDYEAAALDVRVALELALFKSVAAVTLGGKVALLTRTGATCEELESANKPTYAIRLTLEALIRHDESAPDVLQ